MSKIDKILILLAVVVLMIPISIFCYVKYIDYRWDTTIARIIKNDYPDFYVRKIERDDCNIGLFSPCTYKHKFIVTITNKSFKDFNILPEYYFYGGYDSNYKLTNLRSYCDDNVNDKNYGLNGENLLNANNKLLNVIQKNNLVAALSRDNPNYVIRSLNFYKQQENNYKIKIAESRTSGSSNKLAREIEYKLDGNRNWNFVSTRDLSDTISVCSN